MAAVAGGARSRSRTAAASSRSSFDWRAPSADDVRARPAPRRATRCRAAASLARALGVHRNTVLAAYRELAAEGWITTEAAARHVRVARAARRRSAGARGRVLATARADARCAAAVGFDLAAAARRSRTKARRRLALPPQHVLAMSGGDPRRAPGAARAAGARVPSRARAMAPSCSATAIRAAHARCATRSATCCPALRGVAADGESLLVTRGSQMALDLVSRALLAAGRRRRRRGARLSAGVERAQAAGRASCRCPSMRTASTSTRSRRSPRASSCAPST